MKRKMIMLLILIVLSGCQVDPKFHNSEFTRKHVKH